MTIQTRLFASEYPARPKRTDEEVTDLAAKRLVPEVMQWLGDHAEEQRTYEDLRKVLKWSIDDDGFELAQEMGRLGYEPDADLVEILDGAGRTDAHEAIVEEWVRAHDLRLALPIGAQVTAQVNRKTVTGEIVALYPKTAQYIVMVPSEGHVKTGFGTRGYAVGFESVQPLKSDTSPPTGEG